MTKSTPDVQSTTVGLDRGTADYSVITCIAPPGDDDRRWLIGEGYQALSGNGELIWYRRCERGGLHE